MAEGVVALLRTPGSGALVSTSSTSGPLLFTSGCLLEGFPRNGGSWKIALERLVRRGRRALFEALVSTELCAGFRFLGCRIGGVSRGLLPCIGIRLSYCRDDVVFEAWCLAPRADALAWREDRCEREACWTTR